MIRQPSRKIGRAVGEDKNESDINTLMAIGCYRGKFPGELGGVRKGRVG
jgi:hypothetical protein